MTRDFSLAAVLRVRSVQERAAAQQLTRATIDANQTSARERHLRAALAATDAEAVDVRQLAALAASRVAGRSMLADLQSLSELQQEEMRQAQAAHEEVRREVRGLDRLAQAHARKVREADLRAEQKELDEIGSRGRTEDRS